MKARELVDQLQKYDPDEEVIALVWFKDTFDFDSNEDLTLTDEAWLKVVKEMEESVGIDAGEQQISEHISESVVEHSVLDIK